ncbi:uncharacterized protein LOC129724837 isoform X2 [Wyeomyia smithii]|uniref:uncharacterized protein LOC129724837 isoform X2 n=1 Tax=Wyeomyia smithii TaxID=174621 RepID=UPI002467B978|nr:uncharacterized protein LOC129724837 isoform X2 [Wyeomyia smithii]
MVHSFRLVIAILVHLFTVQLNAQEQPAPIPDQLPSQPSEQLPTHYPNLPPECVPPTSTRPVQCPPVEIQPSYRPYVIPTQPTPPPVAKPALTDNCTPVETTGPPACYAHGPLLTPSLLPKPPRPDVTSVGSIGCDEVIGYMMGLQRFYDRKCQRMGDKCPANYQYAINWFNAVVNDMATRCNAAC